MAKPARKWILIPEYRPLFAMQECFGPQHGPLKEPCPTPITIIGKLLRQSGDNKLTIYEVKKNPDKTTTPPVLLTLDNYTLPYDEIVGGKAVDPEPSLEPTKQNAEAVPPVIGNLSDTDDKQPEPEPQELKHEKPPVEPEEEIVEEDPVEETDPEIPAEEPVEEEVVSEPKADAGEEHEEEDVNPNDEVPPEEEAEEPAASATAETEQPLPPEPEVTVTSQSGVEVEGISPKIKPYNQMSKKERKEARRKAAEEAAKTGTPQAD